MQNEISIERDGKVFVGHYVAVKGMITVQWNGVERTTQLGGSASQPASLARIILGELVRENPRFVAD